MENVMYQRIKIENGCPILRGHALPVEDVIEMLAAGVSIDMILEDFEGLCNDDIMACIEYAYAK
jgi:uncharacterized protein (DUF433 family)